jgi:hypothetical protein
MKEENSKIFEGRIMKRCDEMRNAMIEEEWYNTLQDEIIKTRKSIQNILSEEEDKILDKYDMLCMQMHCKTEEMLCLRIYTSTVMTPTLTPNRYFD